MVYGDKRDYPKIELFKYNRRTDCFDYVATTTWSPTLKDAKQRFAQANEIQPEFVMASYKVK